MHHTVDIATQINKNVINHGIYKHSPPDNYLYTYVVFLDIIGNQQSLSTIRTG